MTAQWDGVVYVGVEACDDGNIIDNDGCRANCESPTAVMVSSGHPKPAMTAMTSTMMTAPIPATTAMWRWHCQANEACDDGNLDDRDDAETTAL